MKNLQKPINNKISPTRTCEKCNKSIQNKTVPNTQQLKVIHNSANSHN